MLTIDGRTIDGRTEVYGIRRQGTDHVIVYEEREDAEFDSLLYPDSELVSCQHWWSEWTVIDDTEA